VKVRLSLAVQVVVLLLAVAVPALAALGWVALSRNREALTIDAQHANRLLAELTASTVAAELDRARAALETVGDVLLSSGLRDDDARLALAGARVDAWSGTRMVTMYGKSDRRRLGSLRVPGNQSLAPEVLPPDLDMSRFATGTVREREGRPVLPVSLPVRRTGDEEPTLWVYAEVELEPLLAKVRAFAEAPPVRDPQAIVVFDARHRVVLASEAERPPGSSLQGFGLFDAVSGRLDLHHPLSLSTEFTDQGEPRLGALVTMPEPGWGVVVQQRQTRAYETLSTLRAAVIAAVALAVLLSLGAGVFGARRLVRPLGRLVEASRSLGRRSFTRVDASVSQRADEVGDLARAFDDMSGQLETSQSQLVRETQVRAALARYLSADVVDLVVKDPAMLKLGGEQRLVTVLFADVVGFTRLAESLPPGAIVSVLNEFFSFATIIVRQRGGIVDKFIGDCVMAVWGVPTSHPDDARQALDAAEALRRWAETGSRRWKRQFGVEVNLAMGLHTGLAVAGNVGSDERMEYTVIGDTVNVAARLEASASPNQILVSEETCDAAGRPSSLELLGERNLRGRTKPTRVYEVRT
jgi:adenylate cyclase